MADAGWGAETAVPNLIGGVALIAVGILIVRYRKTLHASILRREDAILRGRGMGFIRGMQKPWVLALVGSFACALGLFTLGMTLAGLWR